MPLFQQSVLKKYISDINKPQLQAAWQLFREHFFNPVIQQNIRDSKEEEYQEGFRFNILKQQKLKANNIQQVIQQTDKEIDAMVYELYGLSEEQIQIVEGK